MIFKLVKANFANANIGTLDQYSINYAGSGFTIVNGPTSLTKPDSVAGETVALNAVIRISSGYALNSIIVTMVGTGTISNAVTDNGDGTHTINIASVTGDVTITINATSSGGSEPETPVNPPSGGTNYIDITTQGTIKGSIKDSVINQSDASSLYLLTKVQLPANAVSVEYQAFKTGGSYGSAFADNSNTVVKFLPKTNITTGERVTETVPSGATYFWHMWDDPNEETQKADAFTYIRVYTSGESGGESGGGAEGLPVRITKQTQNNHGLLDTSTGVWAPQTYPAEQGGQTVTVCSIPAGATTVNYQMFKTGKTYGSGFFNGSTFISGYANNTDAAGTRKTLSIPAGATEFWHMYPNRTYANGDGNCPEFDYIEFA